MSKLVATTKAVVTRAVFGSHGFVAIWQVTIFKKNPAFWYLCTPILLLLFEAVFTLTVKDNQEWKWFCPSVFLYLGSVVPSIWLLELDKLERRLQTRTEPINFTAINLEDLRGLDHLFGVSLELEVDADTWVTLIEQFLMLVLIVGRWMLPKGELTRDQLSQLLLVYIGTAADIIEFFDSFKDERIAREPPLVLLTLAIWTWSLMQFTVVLTATKSRKSRLSASTNLPAVRRQKKDGQCSECCSIDVWGIALNILLQDAPFFVFRLLLICHYSIISYMNVFFTCKNTLVILLQLYRLYVVYSEGRRLRAKGRPGRRRAAPRGLAVVAGHEVLSRSDQVKNLRMISSLSGEGKSKSTEECFSPDEEQDFDDLQLALAQFKALRKKQRVRPPLCGATRPQDTGYSTASSSRESPHCRDIPSPLMDIEDPRKVLLRKSKATMTSRKVSMCRDDMKSRSLKASGNFQQDRQEKIDFRREIHHKSVQTAAIPATDKIRSDSDEGAGRRDRAKKRMQHQRKERYMKREVEMENSEEEEEEGDSDEEEYLEEEAGERRRTGVGRV